MEKKYKLLVTDNNEEPFELSEEYDTKEEAELAAASQLEFMNSTTASVFIKPPDGEQFEYKVGMEIPEAPTIKEIQAERLVEETENGRTES